MLFDALSAFHTGFYPLNINQEALQAHNCQNNSPQPVFLQRDTINPGCGERWGEVGVPCWWAPCISLQNSSLVSFQRFSRHPNILETTFTQQILLNEISYSGTRCFCWKLNTHTDTWRCACFPVCCLIFNYMNRAIVGCMFCFSLLFHVAFPLRNSSFSGAENHKITQHSCTDRKRVLVNLAFVLWHTVAQAVE